MLTLGLDTTTDVCAIALLDGSTVTFEASLDVPRSHGRRLAPLLREAFGHVGREPSDLGLVAVSAGPGSFTGLRIGMSTAKGLVLSTGASIVAVSTLRALAASGARTRPVAVVLPSRRGEVYAAAYDDETELAPPAALAAEEIEGWLPDSVVAIGGPGADRLVGIREDLPRVELRPSAAAVARLGRRRVDREGPDDVATLEPLYLKPVATSQPRGILRASTL